MQQYNIGKYKYKYKYKIYCNAGQTRNKLLEQ